MSINGPWYDQDLQWFEVSWEGDEAKRDPVLVCKSCGVPLCDIEEGDRLDVLAAVAKEHRCEQWDKSKREKLPTPVCAGCDREIPADVEPRRNDLEVQWVGNSARAFCSEDCEITYAESRIG